MSIDFLFVHFNDQLIYLATPTVSEQQAASAQQNPVAAPNPNHHLTQQQGFQSYAGLKSSASEPGAIALKSSSVVPGSAFNFGPTAAAAGLGMGAAAGLYAAPPDKDPPYSNFLDEFSRTQSNYYMAAAAAAHHRSTPEANDKQTRAHHTVSTVPSICCD